MPDGFQGPGGLYAPDVYLPLEKARENRTPIVWRAEDIASPSFTGIGNVTTAGVHGETRNVTLTNGSFTDTFGAYGVQRVEETTGAQLATGVAAGFDFGSCPDTTTVRETSPSTSIRKSGFGCRKKGVE